MLLNSMIDSVSCLICEKQWWTFQFGYSKGRWGEIVLGDTSKELVKLWNFCSVEYSKQTEDLVHKLHQLMKCM